MPVLVSPSHWAMLEVGGNQQRMATTPNKKDTQDEDTSKKDTADEDTDGKKEKDGD